MGQTIKGKTAMITGAGKGIGKAIAIYLAKEGVNLGLVARTESDLKSLTDELKDTGVKVAYAVADISSIDQVNQAVELLTNELGPFDILINNAGMIKLGNFMDIPPEEWKKTVEINLIGTYYVTRAILPQLIDKQSGDILTVSSAAGVKASPITSAYSASKFGIQGFSESLSLEVRKHNIRVTAVTPSTVASEFAVKENLTDGNPEKVVQPEDIAEIVVSQLKLHPRVLMLSSGMESTNL